MKAALASVSVTTTITHQVAEKVTLLQNRQIDLIEELLIPSYTELLMKPI